MPRPAPHPKCVVRTSRGLCVDEALGCPALGLSNLGCPISRISNRLALLWGGQSARDVPMHGPMHGRGAAGRVTWTAAKHVDDVRNRRRGGATETTPSRAAWRASREGEPAILIHRITPRARSIAFCPTALSAHRGDVWRNTHLPYASLDSSIRTRGLSGAHSSVLMLQ